MKNGNGKLSAKNCLLNIAYCIFEQQEINN